MSKEIKDAWLEEFRKKFDRPASAAVDFLLDKLASVESRMLGMETDLRNARAVIGIAEDKLKECGLAFEGMAQLQVAALTKQLADAKAAMLPKGGPQQVISITISNDTSAEEVAKSITEAVNRRMPEIDYGLRQRRKPRTVVGPDGEIARHLANDDERAAMDAKGTKP